MTTLYSFCSQSSCADGANPSAALIQAIDGNFYGTTENGGASNDGTVFKITLKGRLTTLHSFDGTDGSGPAGLIQATDGSLYGATVYGAKGGGTIFKITPAGRLTTLYSFCSQANCTDGAGSAGALVQATDGNFYGTTVGGGATDNGTIFDVTPKGKLTTLQNFDGADGDFPNAALIQATDGSFYGTTEYGGVPYPCYAIHGIPRGCGTVFGLSVGLGPFVETQPSSGKVGAAVKILGTDLSGATSVKFNGTAAVFKVVSSSEITTTVPEGATTGKIDVKTPRGTLKSNVVFRVTK